MDAPRPNLPIPWLPLRCDASSLPASAPVVDALARLTLLARRQGCELQLWGSRPELRELIEFMGLADVLRTED